MRIVCSIDDSTEARHAAEIASRLAGRLGAELVYAHALTGETSERPGERSDRRCDLLVLGYRPRSRFLAALLGQPHKQLIRAATCPILLVPAGARLKAGADIVLAYGVSDLPGGAAEAAGRLAGALDSSLVVLRVRTGGSPSRSTDGQRDAAARHSVEAAVAAAGKQLEVVHAEQAGRPSAQLAALAQRPDAAVLVIGGVRTRRRSMLARSVVTRLQRHARHPMLIVPRRAALPAV